MPNSNPLTSPQPKQQVAQARIRQLLTGKSVPFSSRPGATSAINKSPVDHPLHLDWLGLNSDEQADLKVHGGVHKAIHAYTWEHYSHWRSELPECERLTRPGAFGENFSLDGLDEGQVCIGDQWSAGTALLEVSQGRQPCWKLNERFGVANMAHRVQQNLRAGWYFRVLRRGTVAAGDNLDLVARPHPEWPLARLLALIRDRHCDPTVLAAVLALPLTPSWQRLFSRRAETNGVEDWAPRLDGPTPP